MGPGDVDPLFDLKLFDLTMSQHSLVTTSTHSQVQNAKVLRQVWTMHGNAYIWHLVLVADA